LRKAISGEKSVQKRKQAACMSMSRSSTHTLHESKACDLHKLSLTICPPWPEAIVTSPDRRSHTTSRLAWVKHMTRVKPRVNPGFFCPSQRPCRLVAGHLPLGLDGTRWSSPEVFRYLSLIFHSPCRDTSRHTTRLSLFPACAPIQSLVSSLQVQQH
jgi:hypothetical protein